jgi:LysM repeat protein
MPAASVTGAEGLGQKATSRNMPQTVYETEKRYDYISYYDPVIGHQITSSLTVTVNRGNTLWDIINHQYGNLSGPEMADKIEQIKKINKLTNPNKLSVGQDLVLPDPKFELAERYIDKYRRLNKKINFHSALIERQMVLIREAQPEEMPNNSIKIERYNPEVKTFTVDQTEPRKFYWIAKKEDEETFLKGSKKRREEHKQFLYNLFHGTGVGDITGWASGGASKSSRQLITVSL